MNKFILPVIVLSSFTSFAQNASEARTTYFPTTEIKANRLPDKENLWVFILAGQSNMAGRGRVEPQDTIPSERVFTINKNEDIILAKEPLHFNEPSMRGLDCGLSFGQELIRHIPDNISVLIIPTAVGGSSISQWLGDSTYRNVQLFKNFTEKTSLGARHGIIKGVLWHQGESDSGDPDDIALYDARLAQLITKFREATGNDHLPVMIGELGSFSKNNDNWQKINKQIKVYASKDRNASGIKTSDLKDKGDKVHFDSQGQRTLGQRFAKKYIRKHKQPVNKSKRN
jgi:Carbohydrate esterase, sialic acid-specific acetylesterase